MSAPQNSLTPADYATPEQIDRNLERLRKIGDRGRTGNLLAEWEAKERARVAKQREEFLRRRDEEFDRRQALRLADSPPVQPEAVPVVVPTVIPAGNAVFDFHADGSDLPLFAQS